MGNQFKVHFMDTGPLVEKCLYGMTVSELMSRDPEFTTVRGHIRNGHSWENRSGIS